MIVCEGESGEDENHDDLNQQQTIKIESFFFNLLNLFFRLPFITFEDSPFGIGASHVTYFDSFCLDTIVEGIELRHC